MPHRSGYLKSLDSCVVLVAEDDPLCREIIVKSLSPLYTVVEATSGEEALAALNKVKPDLALLDIMMGGVSGIDVCKSLQESEDESLRNIGVIFVTSLDNGDQEETCWNAGASDFIVKPIRISTLLHRVKAHLTIKCQSDALRNLAYIDSLTGLHNRRYFFEQVSIHRRQQLRDGSKSVIILLDIDHFKQYNDTYGHIAGDDMLKRVATHISSSVRRPRDLVARYGGEEFIVLLSDTDTNGAKQVAQNILATTDTPKHSSAENAQPLSTISIGIVECTSRATLNDHELIECADKALYAAKAAGRARACFYNDGETRELTYEI